MCAQKEQLTDEKYAELQDQFGKLRANYQRQTATLLRLERLIALRLLCPEVHTAGQRLSCGWHNIGGSSVFGGPWEFMLFVDSKPYAFAQERVPEVLWDDEQRSWMKRRNVRRKRIAGPACA
jgi:hypothetical protein